MLDLYLACGVRYRIQIAGWVRFGEICSWRDYAVAQSHQGSRGFQRSGVSPGAWPCIDLVETAGHFTAEHFLDGGGFGGIVDFGPGAVGVDVADGIGCETSILQCRSHGSGCAD